MCELRKQVGDLEREKGAAEAESRRLRAELDVFRAQVPAAAVYIPPVQLQPPSIAPAVTSPPALYAPVGPDLSVAPPFTHASNARAWQPTTAASYTRGCYRCGDPGHFRRDCPRRLTDHTQPSTTQPVTSPSIPNASYHVRSSTGKELQSPRRAYLAVKVNDRVFDCLLDTGCELR